MGLPKKTQWVFRYYWVSEPCNTLVSNIELLLILLLSLLGIVDSSHINFHADTE